MKADNGRIVTNNTLMRPQVRAIFRAFELASGLDICFKQTSSRWCEADGSPLLDYGMTLHRSTFCDEQKAVNLPLCMRNDNTELTQLFPRPVLGKPKNVIIRNASGGISQRAVPLPLLSTEPALPAGALVRTCHAGVTELLMPIWSEGVLVGVVFIGQFQLQTTRGPALSGTNGLRVMSRQEVEQVARLAVLLMSYLHELLRRLDAQKQDPVVGRQGVIVAYIRSSLVAGPTLAGLADTLSLSSSRTSHLVREVTGRSFMELVEAQRLAVACDLLKDSQGKITWIASQVGFNDTAYFCRYFKKKMSMTPTAYRQRHRPTADHGHLPIV